LLHHSLDSLRKTLLWATSTIFWPFHASRAPLQTVFSVVIINRYSYTKIVTVSSSSETKTNREWRCSDRIVVIPNGVDLSKFEKVRVRKRQTPRVIESMAAGTPVIAADIPGVREGNRRRRGWSSFPSREIKELTMKLEELLMNQNLQRRLIHRGFEQVKNFTWDRIAQETERVFVSCS
jgi:glycosyltransferase involved in cell wall biosynthesis